MDWQQLPAVQGTTGFEYKISVIHLATRVKYSEIHTDFCSQTLSRVLQRAVQVLPPFFVLFTDNAMSFTMKYTAHPNRKTALTKRAESMGIIHALIPKGKPWRNAFIERSNRTDNEELFHRMRFKSPEERRYYLRLWEMHYNFERPHQGINNFTPVDLFRKFYQQHFCYCMIYN